MTKWDLIRFSYKKKVLSDLLLVRWLSNFDMRKLAIFQLDWWLGSPASTATAWSRHTFLFCPSWWYNCSSLDNRDLLCSINLLELFMGDFETLWFFFSANVRNILHLIFAFAFIYFEITRKTHHQRDLQLSISTANFQFNLLHRPNVSFVPDVIFLLKSNNREFEWCMWE